MKQFIQLRETLNATVYPRLPRVVTDRVIGKSYLNTKNEIVIWNGKLVNCEHNKQKGVCKICKPLAHFAHTKKIKLNYELSKRCKNKPLNPNKYLPDFGCNVLKILTHIESKFEVGMSWENRNEWDVDHRKPIYSFDLDLPNDVKRCFHYTNLQPLWRVKNQSKGKKFDQKTFGWEWEEDIGWVEKKVVQNKHTITAYFVPLKN